MKKYLLIASFLSCFCLQAFSQSPNLDSLKIDSLNKLLPILEGERRINCMTLICEYYSDAMAADSMRLYGNKILNESKALGYKKGIAMGLLFSSPDLKTLDSKSNGTLREKNTKDAIQIGEEIENDEVLGWGYSFLILIPASTTTDGIQSVGYYKKAIDHFSKAGKIVRAAAMSNWLSQAYMGTGENEKALDYAKSSLAMLTTISPSEFASAYSSALLWSVWNMSMLYSAAGDYESALNYMRMANEVGKTSNSKTKRGDFTLDIASLFTQIGQYDSALIYWNRFKNEPLWDNANFWRPGKMLAFNYLAKIYIGTRQYDKAIELLTNNNIYFDSLLRYSTGNYRNAGNYGKMAASLALSEVYNAKNRYQEALQFAKEGIFQARVKNRRPEIMQGYQLLSSAYHHIGNNDSAYAYGCVNWQLGGTSGWSWKSGASCYERS